MSMSTDWHADTDLMRLYASGALDEARTYSLEAHVLSCEECRRLAAGSVRADFEDRARMDRVWTDVVDRIEAPRPGMIERGLIRLGVRGHIARLLAATPSLRLSWFAAEALVLAFAVLAAYGSRGAAGNGSGNLIFLVVAPLVPLSGVAAAYGPTFDPTFEVGLVAPMRSFSLLLLRASVVLVSSLAIASLAALALPGLDWTVAAWLLPSIGLTAVSVGLATTMSPSRAAGSVMAAWVTLVMASAIRGHDQYLAFRAPAQFAFFILSCVGAVVVARRRESFERRSGS